MEQMQNLLENLKTLEMNFTNDYDLGGEVRKIIREVNLDEGFEYTESKIKNLEDKYLRLLADFDNYKKRSLKEKEDIKAAAKINSINSIIDLDSDLNLASVTEQSEGLKLIMSKFSKFLEGQGIKTIQTETYDSDLHEVISVIPSDEEKIVAVVSKGYTIDGKPFRYPKIILGKPNE